MPLKIFIWNIQLSEIEIYKREALKIGRSRKNVSAFKKKIPLAWFNCIKYPVMYS